METLSRNCFNKLEGKYRITTNLGREDSKIRLTLMTDNSRRTGGFKERPYKPYFLWCIYWWWIGKIYNPYFKMMFIGDNKLKQQILEHLYEKYREATHGSHIDEMTSRTTQIANSINKSIHKVSAMCELLELKEEIKYHRNQAADQYSGYYIVNTGVIAMHEKKYVIEGKNDLWKKRERMFNFISKPIMLLLTIVSSGIAFYQFNRSNEIQKKYEQFNREISIIKTKLEQISHLKNKP